jgi:UDP-N-acetylmuramoylalanine--D-glutamate ligase
VDRGNFKVIVGLGETGYSVAKFLHAAGIDFFVADENEAPSRLPELKTLMPGARLRMIEAGLLMQADEVIVSPGVPMSLPVLQDAMSAGVKMTGDVAMFGELARAPIVAITGSNGKSTVTSMVGALAASQLTGVKVAGNIGTPCLDVLEESAALYVLEVSSFQLELATSLPLKVAALLNLSPDHLDRYPDVESYYRTKGNIYNRCEIAVVNRSDAWQFDISADSVISFGTDAPGNDMQFGLLGTANDPVLAQGSNELILARELQIKGNHNIQNALAALAIGQAAGLATGAMVVDLKKFKGLAHRCEWLGDFSGTTYINDSKATNIGASISAVRGLSAGKNIVLILGGQAKGGDFSSMAGVCADHVKRVLAFGRDGNHIESALQDVVPVRRLDSLDEIVDQAIDTAVYGDTVLFSPACASYDMFENYEIRGETFKRLLLEKLS